MSFFNHPITIAAAIALIILITIPLLSYVLIVEWFSIQNRIFRFDDLTGLYDRRSLRIKIQHRLKHKTIGQLHRQDNRILDAFVLIDLDCFKQVNDTYGHPCGDQLLSHISEVLKSNIRSTDIIGRLGGDEFVIYLPHIKTISNVKTKVSRITNAVSSSLSQVPQWKHVTFSIGIALAPRDGSDFDRLYERADIALYEAKKAGKNQAVIYGSNLCSTLDGSNLRGTLN
ncbi:diguanylate cyclase [Clostridium sp. MCC353]|uniref:GGDEF domain-containing protein n=1 Tax=Clostridium sp. MCC353 TaxID=2592646 RepID=UPI001C01A966|nr:GGDEF domain-containing protein [Clostridium sp. MCC353]MBT9776525.1 diguanylate cyclase [Clostridium sp. MCC353]